MKPKTQKNPNGAGRESKLTPAVQAEICGFIKEGMYQEEAARLVHIHPSTLHDWKAKNAEFADALKDAASEFERESIAVIREHSINRYDREGRLTRRGNWMARAWLLERTRPERFGLRWQGELTGSKGKPLIPESSAQVDTSKFTKAQLDKLILATDLLLKNPVKSESNGHTNGNGDT